MGDALDLGVRQFEGLSGGSVTAANGHSLTALPALLIPWPVLENVSCRVDEEPGRVLLLGWRGAGVVTHHRRVTGGATSQRARSSASAKNLQACSRRLAASSWEASA